MTFFSFDAESHGGLYSCIEALNQPHVSNRNPKGRERSERRIKTGRRKESFQDALENGLKKRIVQDEWKLGWSSVASQPCFACSWCSIPSFCVPDFQDDPGTRSLHCLQDRVELEAPGRHRNPIHISFCVPKYSSHHETKTTCHPCAASRIACRSSRCRHLRSPNALPLRLHPPLPRTCPGVFRSPRSALLEDPDLQRALAR